jgi:hypothetical protein
MWLRSRCGEYFGDCAIIPFDPWCALPERVFFRFLPHIYAGYGLMCSFFFFPSSLTLRHFSIFVSHICFLSAFYYCEFPLSLVRKRG